MRSSRMSTLPDVGAAPVIGSTAHGYASKALWTSDRRCCAGWTDDLQLVPPRAYACRGFAFERHTEKHGDLAITDGYVRC